MELPFKIDPEFRRHNRQQTRQERMNLERMIEEDGCKEGSLVVGVIGEECYLVDGHNTLEICLAKEIPLCEPRLKEFADREEALDWIHLLQRSRRNLTNEEMAENRAERIPRVVHAKVVEGKSNREIAQEEGISKRQVQLDLEKAELDSPPISTVRCDRCTRLNLDLRDCPQCQSLRRFTRHVDPPTPPIIPPTSQTDRCPTCKGSGRVPKSQKEPFKKPTLAQVQAYCAKRQNSINPECFMAFYEANGWRVGKNPMKSWEASVRYWETNPLGLNGKPVTPVNAERERAIALGWYKPSSGEPYDPAKHHEP